MNMTPIWLVAPDSVVAMDTQWRYSGRELESMTFAMNYHRWILDIFRPYLGRRIVEVGAGSGSFSELLLETAPERLDAIEPSANMYPLLTKRLSHLDSNGIGHPHQGTLVSLMSTIAAKGQPDSIIYVNVLEHVEDDVRELKTVHSLLQPGGHALIFVPAMPGLMSNMDRQLGHFRRYTRAELNKKSQSVGFRIRVLSYFDFLGIAPWWLKYCLLQSRTMESRAIRFYDHYVVPMTRQLERFGPMPIGKNLVMIAEKTK